MPADFHKARYLLPKYKRGTYLVLMKSLKTSIGFGENDKAQFRLHCIEALEKLGWQSFHQAFPNVSKATV
jgi:hypothetical protein